MAEKPELHFSHAFEGAIWNMMLVPDRSVLVLEIRNEERRNVSFSAFDFLEKRFLWTNVTVAEPWWVNLSSATENAVVLTKFENTSNPDTVSYLALDLELGTLLKDFPKQESQPALTDVEVPIQYFQESDHFGTVKNFLSRLSDKEPVHFVEYLESSGLIFISVYYKAGEALENYLLVFAEDGKKLLEEKIGNSLKGLGLETFFVLSGLLFYVKNKVELVTYSVV